MPVSEHHKTIIDKYILVLIKNISRLVRCKTALFIIASGLGIVWHIETPTISTDYCSTIVFFNISVVLTEHPSLIKPHHFYLISYTQ